MRTLEGVIALLEKAVKGRIKLRPEFKRLPTVSGIGGILGLNIMVEAGAIGRFAKVGNYASYCRSGLFTKTIRTAWPWRGTEEFLGLRAARGRVSTPHGDALGP